jgi:hypothetical protein
MALFTLTINNLSPALDKQHQETERIHRYLEAAAQDMRSDGGAVVGSWTLTPQATS